MLLDHIARQVTKEATRSTFAAFVAHTATRIAVHEPAREARRKAMKQRKAQKPNRSSQQLGHH
jgi:hypothetical protein